MRRYLFHAPGGRVYSSPLVGAIVEVPSDNTAGDWKYNYERFTAQTHALADFSAAASLHEDQMIDGIYYEEWLSGSQGMSFNVIHMPGIAKARITRVRQKLKRDRDVVGMHILRIESLVDFVWEPAPAELQLAAVATWSDRS